MVSGRVRFIEKEFLQLGNLHPVWRFPCFNIANHTENCIEITKQKWNVTPLIRRGSNFYFFAALYFALLDLLPCLQARGYEVWRIAIRAVSQVRQNKVLLRNNNYCPDTNEWRILFCQPKASSARSCNIPLVYIKVLLENL